MNLLEFIAFYILLLCCSSLFILGFYVITRGQKEKQPDGTLKITGKIFKGWSLYWERITEYRKVYYKGSSLKEKMFEMLEADVSFRDIVYNKSEEDYIKLKHNLSDNNRVYLEKMLQIKLKIEEDRLYVYAEEPVYQFPEWIRYLLSQCPPCMASLGGSIIYWSFVYLQNDLFLWAGYHVFASIFFWIFFCVSLSCLNKVIYNFV